MVYQVMIFELKDFKKNGAIMNYAQKIIMAAWLLGALGLPVQAAGDPCPQDELRATAGRRCRRAPASGPTLSIPPGAAISTGAQGFEKYVREHHRGKVGVGGLIALFAWWELSAHADKIKEEIKRRTDYDFCSVEEQKIIDKKIAYALGWNSFLLRSGILAAGAAATAYGAYFSRDDIAAVVCAPQTWQQIAQMAFFVIIQHALGRAVGAFNE
jgi:hypothetical protein